MRPLIAAFSLAVLLSSPAFAQNPGGIPWEDPPERRMTVKRPQKGEWMIGVDGGRTNYPQPEFERKGTRFVGFAERNFTPWLGVQADLNCSKGTVAQTILNPPSFIGLCTTALSAVVPIPVAYSIWPYVRVGGGYAFWDEESVEGIWDVDVSEPALVMAAGARYFPFGNDKIALRLDIQRTQTAIRDLDVGLWSYGFGLTLRIPKAAPSP